MFGSLLPTKPPEGEEDIEETDAPAPGKEGEKEGEVRESMADILLAKNKLSSLQKQVNTHTLELCRKPTNHNVMVNPPMCHLVISSCHVTFSQSDSSIEQLMHTFGTVNHSPHAKYDTDRMLFSNVSVLTSPIHGCKLLLCMCVHSIHQVCGHVIQSVHAEVERMKEEWETRVSRGPPPKLARQGSSVEPPAAATEGEGGSSSSDTYCFELLSMLIGLSQSEIGCGFLSQQETLVQDLFSLLHVASSRMQKQVHISTSYVWWAL